MKFLKILPKNKEDFAKWLNEVKWIFSKSGLLFISIIIGFSLLISFVFFLIVKQTFLKILLVWIVFFFVCFILQLIGQYICIINSIDDKYSFGIAIGSVFVFLFSYLFFSNVSYDRSFIIASSIIVTYIAMSFFCSNLK